MHIHRLLRPQSRQLCKRIVRIPAICLDGSNAEMQPRPIRQSTTRTQMIVKRQRGRVLQECGAMRQSTSRADLAKVDEGACREVERDEAVAIGLHDNNDVCGATVRAENVVASVTDQVFERVGAAPVYEFLFVAVAAFPEAVAVGFAAHELAEGVGAIHVCVAAGRGVDALRRGQGGR
jgi:hypothetical protein